MCPATWELLSPNRSISELNKKAGKSTKRLEWNLICSENIHTLTKFVRRSLPNLASKSMARLFVFYSYRRAVAKIRNSSTYRIVLTSLAINVIGSKEISRSEITLGIDESQFHHQNAARWHSFRLKEKWNCTAHGILMARFFRLSIRVYIAMLARIARYAGGRLMKPQLPLYPCGGML